MRTRRDLFSKQARALEVMPLRSEDRLIVIDLLLNCAR